MVRKLKFLAALVMVGMLVSVGAASPTGTELETGQVGVCVGSGCTLSEGQLGGGQTDSFAIPITRTGAFELNPTQTLGVRGNVDPVQTLAFGATEAKISVPQLVRWTIR
jgi:hypothetical protein